MVKGCARDITVARGIRGIRVPINESTDVVAIYLLVF